MATKGTYTHKEFIDSYWKGPWVSYRIKGSKHACREARKNSPQYLRSTSLWSFQWYQCYFTPKTFNLCLSMKNFPVVRRVHFISLSQVKRKPPDDSAVAGRLNHVILSPLFKVEEIMFTEMNFSNIIWLIIAEPVF